MGLRLVATLILLFLLAPILIVIPLSFSSASYFVFPPPGFSLKWYHSFLSNDVWIDAMIRSLLVGLLTAILATIIGTMAAIAITRLEFQGKMAVMGLMISPMVIPLIVVAIAIYRSYSYTHLVGTNIGLVLAHSLLAIPIVFVTVTASMQGVDRNIEMAALGLGSTPIGVFFKITLPLIRPAMLSAALFAFITSLDELVVTIFISGVSAITLPKVMWDGIRTQVDPTITAVASILIALTTLLFLLQAWFTQRQTRIKQAKES